MTGTEAQEALKRKRPVKHNGIEYLYIDELRYRLNRDGVITGYAVMIDKNKNSETVAPFRDVEVI